MRQAIAPRLAMRTRWNMAPLRSPLPDEQADRRWVVSVAGVIELRTIRDEHEHVHLGAHLDVASGARHAVGKGEAAFQRDWHVHEEVDVARQVALAHAPSVTRKREEEAVAAVVHELLDDGAAPLV